jgi:LysR family glycine cleavage system transcriptional activator
MNRRIPPLNSLRSFEAAGRHLSFTRAAEELCVTQAAISHQVRALEENLGVALFKRLPRKLVMTAAGYALLPEITASLDRIESAVLEVKQREGVKEQGLSIRVAPSFAAIWLSPRLKDFWQKYPDINLRLYHSHLAVEFDQSEIDLGLTYGDGQWPGVEAFPLLKLGFFPVCSPDLLGDERLDLTQLLSNYNLLHDADYRCWKSWLDEANIQGVNAYRGQLIDDTNVLINAAIDGQGIALGSEVFAEKYLESGQLVRLSDVTFFNDEAYYLVCPEAHLQKEPVAIFKQWILSQL